MNFKDILKEIEKTDSGTCSQPSDRRNAMKQFGAKAALVALPLGLGTLFAQKAQAKSTTASATVDALNFLLKIKYFEYNFFHAGNNTGGLIPTTDLPGFKTIEAQELQHINFLTATVKAFGGTPYTPPNYDATSVNPPYIPSGTYDFTAAGKYPTFSSYVTFLVLANVFEDTSVHAIKSQIPTFIGDATHLTQLMQLQCTEARHAAHVRLIRRFLTPAQADYPAPWITNNIPPLTSLQSFYLGEDNATQKGVVITSLAGATGTVPLASATAGFDESLDSTTILNLLKPFFV